MFSSVLYLLNIKLLFRLTIVELLGCCEFNPNVTSVRISSVHQLLSHMLPEPGGEDSGRAKWGCCGLLELTGENRARDIDS